MTRYIILLFGLFTVFTIPLQAQSWHLFYKSKWNGITIAHTHVDFSLAGYEGSQQDYDVKIETKMVGLATMFSEGHAMLLAKGSVKDGVISNNIYHSYGQWDGLSYDNYLAFDEQGAVKDHKISWPQKWLEEDKRAPVPKALQTGPDPVSPLIIAILQDLKNTPSLMRGYDGKSVVDLSVSCAIKPNDKKKKRYKKSMRDFDVTLDNSNLCGIGFETIAGKIELSDKDKKKREKAKAKREKKLKKGKITEDDILYPVQLWTAKMDGMNIPTKFFTASSNSFKVVLAEFERKNQPKETQSVTAR